MIHLHGPILLAAALVGIGLYGALSRRNAILVLVGVELVLAGASVLLVSAGSLGLDTLSAGGTLALFVITVAAAEVSVALAVILAAHAQRGTIDLDQGSPDGPELGQRS